MDFNVPSVGKKRVVIVGGGFGGLNLQISYVIVDFRLYW